jgi:threonine aldolase
MALQPTQHTGGRAWIPSQIETFFDFAYGRGLNVHIEGARIFNAP